VSCLAEGGGLAEEAETQALYSGTSIGHPMVLTEGRYRVFGGSATRWGGKAVVLDPIDFESRSWVRNSGWPITRKSLLPYYERAKKVSNFQSPWLDNAKSLASIDRTIPNSNSKDVSPHVWRVSSPDLPRAWKTYFSLGYKPGFDWARSYGPALIGDRNTFIVLHANLIAMTGSDNGDSIKGAVFKSLSGNFLHIRSKIFVLSCSGIENARMALNLPENVLARLNRFDNVGRYFAQHPTGRIISLKTTKAQALRLQKTFNQFARPPRYPVQYILGFALSDAAQRKHEILNASAYVQYHASEESAWAAARRLRDALKTHTFSRSTFNDIRSVVLNAGDTLDGAFKKYVTAFELILSSPRVEVVIDLEQEPNRESRICLSNDVDALGVRRVEVDWRISELERKTARVFAQALAPLFDNLALGQPELENWLFRTDPLCEDDLHGNYHFIGATRMASAPTDGVVDENCRAFGVNNLFFAGASVFPTGGHANPTLTIVGLAIGLADQIRAELAPTVSREISDTAFSKSQVQ
jgi:GMC oxidoreductase